uniref:MYND-type domain-containing protein n=1 Tax=Heterosigma akashiwo TaxID=2829 RepID=A0A7S3US75_HETAK
MVTSLMKFMQRNNRVFEGGAPPQSSRTYLRPERTSDVYWEFRWRLMCDEAFQEHEEPYGMLCPIPLRNLNFNWKLNDTPIGGKWHDATYILFIESGVINYNTVRGEMLPLHYGELKEESYTNPKNHQRVVSINRTIQEWRTPFDEAFDETSFFQDQRCIFSVCSDEIWLESESQHDWLTKFLSACQENNFCIDKTPGNYQKRLDVYCSLKNFDTPTPFYRYQDLCPPKEYEPFSELVMPGWRYEQCNADPCLFRFEDEQRELRKCAGCKVVKYCSRKCQKKDWQKHKKDCKVLAAMYQDKAQVSNICKKG